MRKIITLIALAGVFGLTVLLAGCQNYSYIRSDNREEKIRQFSRIAEMNSRMLGSDLDTYLLLDKPSSLSHWHMPVRIR